MQIVNIYRNDEDDSMWSLIAEAVFNDGTVIKELRAAFSAGSFNESMHELGLSLETLNRMERAIIGAARKSINGDRAGRKSLPVCVQLFCHRRSMSGAPHPEELDKGGWEFFLIERGRNDPNTCYQEYVRIVELYLFREKPA